VLKLLSVEHPSPVLKDGTRWFRTATSYRLDTAQIEKLCRIREEEQQTMMNYMHSDKCLMRFLSKALDDPYAQDCGKCAVCRGEPLLPEKPSLKSTHEASIFLRRSHQRIEPRKQWPSPSPFESWGWKGKLKEDLNAEEGRALALWGDAGWGRMVQQGKYQAGRFSDNLIEGCVEMIQSWSPEPFPTWLTCVPSLTHTALVPDFARRLAERLNLPFIPCIRKVKQNAPQKEMQNSYQQAKNLVGVFQIDPNAPKDPVFLVDDMVDSRWTMTVLAAILRQHGCEAVFPLALALNSF